MPGTQEDVKSIGEVEQVRDQSLTCALQAHREDVGGTEGGCADKGLRDARVVVENSDLIFFSDPLLKIQNFDASGKVRSSGRRLP